MAWLIRFLMLAVLFQHCQVPGNNSYSALGQGEGQGYGNSSCVSFDTILENLLKHDGFGPGLGDPNRLHGIQKEAFVEETSFAPDSPDLNSRPLAVGLMELRPEKGSAWPGFTAIRRFFCVALERLSAFVQKLVSRLDFEIGLWDNTRPSQIHLLDKVEAIVEETTVSPDSQDLKSPCVALIELRPEQGTAWPSFEAIRRFLHQVLEHLHGYLRELAGSLPEEGQPITRQNLWQFRFLTIAAAVEAAVVIGTCLISRHLVKSTYRSTAEELDRVQARLQTQRRMTHTAEKLAQDICSQLHVHERAREYQALLLSNALRQLQTIDRTCQAKEFSLARKLAEEAGAEARMRQALEKAQVCRRQAEVCFMEETLSSQIQEEKQIRKLLADVSTSITEILEADFSSSAVSSQCPPPDKV